MSRTNSPIKNDDDIITCKVENTHDGDNGRNYNGKAMIEDEHDSENESPNVVDLTNYTLGKEIINELSKSNQHNDNDFHDKANV